MNNKFEQIYEEKKLRIVLYLNSSFKNEISRLSKKNDTSISELVESLYQRHRKAIGEMKTPIIEWQRGVKGKGKGQYSNQVTTSIMITPSALSFFDEQAQFRVISRSKVIEYGLRHVFHIEILEKGGSV